MPRRRWLWILVALPLAAGLARLRFDADVLQLLPADLSAVRALQLQQRHFPEARELWVTVHAGDSDVARRTAQDISDQLSAWTNLVRSVRSRPAGQERPEDAAENIAW